MSTFKEIEKTVNDINKFISNLYDDKLKLEFDKGNTKNGITHKIFNIFSDGKREELKREKNSKDLLKWLEGYLKSLQYHARDF